MRGGVFNAPPGPPTNKYQDPPPPHRRTGHADRRQNLHLYQRPHYLRGAWIAMVIYLPSQSVDAEPILDELTPREIVRELDKHVIGQAEAKRAVAIALRNRIRRQN